jgi:hypothetical protein
MAKLTYEAIASLDGYVEDEAGRFDWATPDEEVHLTAPATRRHARPATRWTDADSGGRRRLGPAK